MTEPPRRNQPSAMASRADGLARRLIDAGPVAALRSRAWWRALPVKIGGVVLAVVAALTVFTWVTGGVTATAAYLLRKETRTNVPGSDRVRRLAARVLTTRQLTPDVLAQLLRVAHVLEPDDPLRPLVLTALSRSTGVPVQAPARMLPRLDEAVARVVGRPLGPHGIVDWRPLDPYFVTWIDELAGSRGTAVAVDRFNALQPDEGLPTSEWYLDELVAAFGDGRPVPFVLVASTSGDHWGPLAMAPDDVPAGVRRLPARTVGEALRIGLWGFDAYHPGDPTTDPTTWWQSVSQAQALPAFAPLGTIPGQGTP